MLRRNPTRIELKTEDILEFHRLRIEAAKSQQDLKKIMNTAGQLKTFVRQNKQELKTTLESLHQTQPQTRPPQPDDQQPHTSS